MIKQKKKYEKIIKDINTIIKKNLGEYLNHAETSLYHVISVHLFVRSILMCAKFIPTEGARLHFLEDTLTEVHKMGIAMLEAQKKEEKSDLH